MFSDFVGTIFVADVACRSVMVLLPDGRKYGPYTERILPDLLDEFPGCDIYDVETGEVLN